MAGKLEKEIQQSRPFSSLQEEVVLAMIRTADQISGPMTDVLREKDLSLSQYNVLRILRGAGREGLACGEIAGRMIRRDPDLTRLLDRLEKRALVTRKRGTSDRRVVRAVLTEEGSGLLDELDARIEATARRTLAHVASDRLATLRELLEEARGPVGEPER